MALAVGTGCGGEALGPSAEEDGEVESGELGTLEQALNSACGTFPPQATRTGRTGLFSIGPSAQAEGCQGNSYILQLNDYNVGFAPLLLPRISPHPIPTTQADCVATDVRFYVWEMNGSTPTFLGSKVHVGIWEGAQGCNVSISSPVSMVTGRDYKIGFSARRPASANHHVVLVHNFQPQ